jgi:hypothetical protein
MYHGHDGGAGHQTPAVLFLHRAEGSVQGGAEGSKVKDVATDDMKRTCGGVAQGTMDNDQATDTVIPLCSKVEGHTVGL